MKTSWLAASAALFTLLAQSGLARAESCAEVGEGANTSITGKYFKINMSDDDFGGFSRQDNDTSATADPATWFDSGHYMHSRIDFRVRNGNCFIGVSHITFVNAELDGTKHTGCDDSTWGYQKFRYSVATNGYTIIGKAITEVAWDVADHARESSDDWIPSEWTASYDFDMKWNLTGIKKEYTVTAKTRLSVHKAAGEELTSGYLWDVNTVCM
ncbi:MAG: hypothetical protein QM820_38055 [Minicystis sp.]